MTSGDQIWIDGGLVPLDQARISPLDHGLTVGDGVFETLKVTGGEAFALGRHLRRLRTSAAGLGLKVPASDPELRAAAAAVIEANGYGSRVRGRAPRGRLRITVTGGVGPLGSDRADAAATLVVAVSPATPPPATVDVITVGWRRNEHSAVSGLKTTSYAENVVALARAHQAGADEAILANTAGELCEGTGTNVFVVLGERVLTPPLRSGCLAGITRELLLELGGVDQEPLPLAILHEADEVFVTSSLRDVTAVAHVDAQPVPAAPGPRTAALAAAFADLVAAGSDP